VPGDDLKDIVKSKTNGRGVDIVYDCVGGDTAEPLVRALDWNGRFLVVGFAGGEIPRVPLNLLLLKGAEIAGVFWGEFVKRDPADHAANMSTVLKYVSNGQLNPRLHATFPLERYRDALAVLERREATGKVIVTL
jgi:NADPH:quinone reductase